MGEAGWKQDPARADRHRWWDGSAWTDHVAPGPDGAELGIDPLPSVAAHPVEEQGAPPLVAAATEPAQEAARAPALTTQGGTRSGAGAVTSARRGGGAPVWADATPASTSSLPAVTARAVHRIVVLIGAVMLLVASVQMILLESVAGNTVAESFYNATGWALLGATLWGVASFSLREMDAERRRVEAPGTRG